MAKKETTLKERLLDRWNILNNELTHLVQLGNSWRMSACIEDSTISEDEDINNFIFNTANDIDALTVSKLRELYELDKQIKSLTPDQEKFDDLCYSISDVANCITKDIPIDPKSFNGFMILLTANVGELQERIASLPDSVEWKKDALDKLDGLLTGGK